MKPLELSKGQIETHWQTLQRLLRDAPLPAANKFTVSPNWVADAPSAVLNAPNAEWVDRERGGRVSAVPIFETSPVYWLSWKESWEFAGNSRWRFRESGVTIFEGKMAVAAKNQLFRAEWAGFAKHFGGVVGWQAPGAAHPHWQFDALAEIERDASKHRLAQQIADELSLDEPLLEEFDENTSSGVMKPPPSWTRMHFAAAARWHEVSWAGNTADVTAHAHSPVTSKEIQSWLIAVICYVKSELARHRM